MKKCWICNNPGTTGEHLFKASDIKLYFHELSQKNPIFIHKKNRKNIHIGGKKNDHLKSNARLCSFCNNTRTRDHDDAWMSLSNYICKNGAFIARNSRVDLKKVWPGKSKKCCKFVHLYFLKLFGCLLVESKNDNLAKEFAASIITESVHPDVFLSISDSKAVLGGEYYGVSGLDVVFSSSGELVSAGWEYMIGEYTISIRYMRPDQGVGCSSSGWNPLNNSRIIRLNKRLPAI